MGYLTIIHSIIPPTFDVVSLSQFLTSLYKINILQIKIYTNKIITRKVRRLKPTEIDYILSGVITYDDQLESDYENYVDEARKAEKARQSLQGLYKNLAIIEGVE